MTTFVLSIPQGNTREDIEIRAASLADAATVAERMSNKRRRGMLVFSDAGEHLGTVLPGVAFMPAGPRSESIFAAINRWWKAGR